MPDQARSMDGGHFSAIGCDFCRPREMLGAGAAKACFAVCRRRADGMGALPFRQAADGACTRLILRAAGQQA